MNSSTWIAIYLPLIIIFLIVLPQQSEMQRILIMKMRKRKGLEKMTNEMLKKYTGMECTISTGSFGNTVKGVIIDVQENWVEIETKRGKELINAEFVQSIKISKQL